VRITSISAATAFILIAATLPARADVLQLDCKSSRNQPYKVTYDTETKELKRITSEGAQSYKIIRSQFELTGDALVWGQTKETHGDILVFFGSKQMVKNFYGNGSEVTDSCTQK
jgi:hypothetical protein